MIWNWSEAGNLNASDSANDQLYCRLSLFVFVGGNQQLPQMMTTAPGGSVVGSGLEQVGPGARIAEGRDVIAEAGRLTGHLKMFHESEVILRQLSDRRATTGDDDKDISRVRVAIARSGLGRLNAERQGFAGG